MFWNKHVTNLCIKCLLHLKYVLALLWEIWNGRLSRQLSTFCTFYHCWISTDTTGSLYLKNCQTCTKLRHLYTTCSKVEMSASSAYQDLGCRQIDVMHQERVNSLKHAVYWTCSWRRSASVHLLAFKLEADISSIWCKDDVTYNTFDHFWDNNCQSCL